MNYCEKTGVIIPILNGLTPTVESCTMKVLEEVGELMQLIGKHSGLNGEKQTMSDEVRIRRTIFEALDVAQSAITMAHTLCELHELTLESFVERHESKLKQKGYLVIGGKSQNPYKRAEAELKKIEQKCTSCRYDLVTNEILNELGYDPCERCGEDCREWEPKEEVIDPAWMVCQNCRNQPPSSDIPERCEDCEDNEYGRPSNFVRRKVKK